MRQLWGYPSGRMSETAGWNNSCPDRRRAGTGGVPALKPCHYGQPPEGTFLMTDPEPSRVGDDTLVGPDGDLDGEDPRLAQGPRLTGAVAGLIVEQIRQAAGRLPRPDLSGAQPTELMPRPEHRGEPVAELQEPEPR